MTRSEQRRQAILLCYRLVLLAACSFCWLSLFTFDPADWPSTKVWPHPSPASNLCGTAGAWMAYQLFYWLGSGGYVLVLFVTVATIAAMVRGKINDPWLRAIGITFLVAGTAASVRMVAPTGVDSLPHGNGGIVGVALVHSLSQHCSTAGTALIVLCAIAIGLLLAVEGLMILLPPVVSRIGHQAAALAGTAGYVLVDRTDRALSNAAAQRERIQAEREQRAEARKKAPPAVAKQPKRVQATQADEEPDESLNDVFRRAWSWFEWPRMPKIDLGRLRRPKVKDDSVEDGDSGEPASSRRKRGGLTINPPFEVQEAEAEPEDAAESVDELAGVDAEDEEEDGENPDDLKGSLAEAPTKVVVRSGKPTRNQKAKASPYPKRLGDYELPSLRLLEDPEYGYIALQESVVREKAKILERTLEEFRIETRVVEIDTGPVITMYELALSPGIKVSRIASLSNDIARALKAPSVRVVAPLPGKNTIGIEVPNSDKENVRLKELLTMGGSRPTKMQLPLFLGKDASGRPLICDLAKMPHMLIAGTTGSGKSVCMNSIVMSMLMTQRPDTVKLILVDPKMVEMSIFKDVPHLMCPIITDMARAEQILDWATTKMDERYELLAEASVRNIAAYNKLSREDLDEAFQPASDEERAKIPHPMPHLIIMIDELADLMMTSAKEVEYHLSRLAQKSRAVGVHIIVATQRPEAKIVTGLIKSNLPCRAAFRVASRMDSRIVLDQNGGEVLMGQGDMLFLPPGTSKLTRAQGTYVSDEELKAVIKFLAEQTDPDFHPELMKLGTTAGTTSTERDTLFDEAARIIIESGRGSVSLLQRRLTVGYGRASRLVDQMAQSGIVGPYKGSQAREVCMTLEEYEAWLEGFDDDDNQEDPTLFDYDHDSAEIDDEPL